MRALCLTRAKARIAKQQHTILSVIRDSLQAQRASRSRTVRKMLAGGRRWHLAASFVFGKICVARSGTTSHLGLGFLEIQNKRVGSIANLGGASNTVELHIGDERITVANQLSPLYMVAEAKSLQWLLQALYNDIYRNGVDLVDPTCSPREGTPPSKEFVVCDESDDDLDPEQQHFLNESEALMKKDRM